MNLTSLPRRILAALFTVLALVAPTLAQTLTLNCRTQDGSLYSTQLDSARRWSMPLGKPTTQTPDGRILGAHVVSYERVSGDLALYVVRISNGACLPNGTGFAGKVYYSALWLDAEPGWSIEPEVPRCAGVFGGPRLPLVAPGQHVALPGSQFIRRFALRRGAVTAEQARAAIDHVPRTALMTRSDFGPSRSHLPRIDLAKQEAEYAPLLKTLRAALTAGNASPPLDLRTNALGAHQPPGNPVAYEHGGQGIWFASRAQSRSALLFERTMADLWQERMSTACFHRVTGQRITSEDWAAAAGNPYQPFETIAHGDEEHRDAYAANKAPHYPPALAPDRKFNAGTCPYEPALVAYDTVDDAHLTRATLPAKVAAWFLADQAAIDFLLDLGHHERMAWCEIGPTPNQWTRSLRADLALARSKPNQGWPTLGRAFGWIADLDATCIALARTKAERLTFERWGKALLEVQALVAMPNGFEQRAVYGTGDMPSAWDSMGMPQTRDAARVFEWGIKAHGVLALTRQLGLLPETPEAAAALRAQPGYLAPVNLAIVERAALAILDNPLFTPRPYDGGKQMGPPNAIAVAVKGGAPLAKIAFGVGSDPAHVEPVLVELYRATGNRRWLDLLCRYGYPAPTLAAKRDWYMRAVVGEIQFADRSWYVTPLGALQEWPGVEFSNN